VNGTLSARRTDWSARQDPETGARIDAPISRQLFVVEATATGPVFSRIFDTPGNRWVERLKHVITPSVRVTRRSAFDAFDEVVPLDRSVDLVVGGVTEVRYGISNSILARVRRDEGESVVREIASLSINQAYYSKQDAATYDGLATSSFGGETSRLPPPGNFGAIGLSLNLTPTATMSGGFGLQYDTQFNAVRSYDARANVARPTFDISGTWTKQQVIPGLRGFDDPRFAVHSLTFNTRIRKPDGGASLAYSTTIDILNDRFLQHRLGALYNAQCCGITMDYVVRNLSHYGLRNDKRFSISFSLAGIGSFVNPLGVFGNNSR
jgi:hypothetical protein